MSTASGQDRVIAGRYRVLRPLGAGAHGVVDLAEDLLGGGRRVAVKRLEGIVGAGDPEPAADILRWFLHPRWAEVLDEGRLDAHGRFQVTRYIPGHSLDKVELPLPGGEVVRFLEDGARVLSALHGRGLIHYDVTPGNWIREERPGGPVFTLTDGGLANVGPVRGIARGTPLFMAPEVVEGAPHDLRADLYALGLVAYRLATGTDPFRGGAGEVLGKRRREAAPLARTRYPEIAPNVERVLARLLERDPDRRPLDGAALLALLHAEGCPVGPETLPEEAVAMASSGRLVGHVSTLARFRDACRALVAAAPSRAPGDEVLGNGDRPATPDLVLAWHGPSGCGGTRLAREMAAVARTEGIAVLALSGREGAADRRHPLRRLSDALSHLLSEPDEARGSPASEVRAPRGAGELREVGGWGPRAFEGLVDLCERVVARTPLVLLVEDFVELPPSAQEGLRVLSRHLLTRAEHPDGRQPPRLVLGIDHGSEDPQALLIPDAAEPRRPCVAVGPLEPADVRTLLAERFSGLEPPPEDLRAILDVSEGLPRHLVSLLAEGLSRRDVRREAGRWIWVTDALSAYPTDRLLSAEVARALDAATPEARDLLSAIAMLDVPAVEPMVQALADAPTLASLADGPLVARSNEGTQTRWAPASRGLREMLRRQEPARLAPLRRRLVALLQELHLDELAPDEARLLLEEGQPKRAFTRLVEGASKRAPAVRARATAVLGAVLRADPALLSTAQARLLAAPLVGTTPESVTLLELLSAALPAPLTAEDLPAAALLATQAYAVRRYDLGIRLGELGGALEVDSIEDATSLARLRVAHARSHLAARPSTGAHALVLAAMRALRAAGRTARKAEGELVASAVLASARLRYTQGQYKRAAGLNRRAIRRARHLRALSVAAQAYNNLAICLQQDNCAVEAEAAISRCIRIRTALGDLQGVVGNLHNLARLKQIRGVTLDSAAIHSRAVALGSRFAHYAGTALSLLSLADIYDQQRNPRLTIACLLRARDIGKANGLRDQHAEALQWAAIVLSQTGELQWARRLLHESACLARTLGDRPARQEHFAASATFSFLLGDWSRAAGLLHRILGKSTTRVTTDVRLAVRALGAQSVRAARRITFPSNQRGRLPYRRALARVIRLVRPGTSASTHSALGVPRALLSESDRLSAAQQRLLCEVLLASAGRIHEGDTRLRPYLDEVSRFAGQQDFLLTRARAGALRCLTSLRAHNLPAASQELSSALAELRMSPRRAAADEAWVRDLRIVPLEFRLVLGALSPSPLPGSEAGGQREDLWTSLHASAHRLLLRSGSVSAPDTRLQAALRTILSVAARLQTGAGLEALLESLNAYAREITKAEHTCVVLLDATGAREIRIASSSTSSPSGPRFSGASQTVIKRVLASRTPLLLHDIFGDSELMERPSIVSLSLRSVLCVPMMRGDQLYGAMYADSSAGAGSFDKVDLEILSLFAEQAAAAIETSRLLVDVQRSYSELKAAQDRLIRGERLRVMGEMTSGVAHEFNNLLTAILARIQLLNLEYLSTETRASLSLIEKAALDAAGVVRRLQGFTRSQRQADYQRVDLAEVCADVVELLRPLWATRRNAGRPPIVVRLRANRGLFVRGDPTELREVATNLLKNALDAMEKGGEIVLSAESRAGRVRAEVSDNGPGISKEQQAKLFTPFFTTKGERGTGLGLCLSQQIVERHGGEIRITSEEGRGTVSAFELPEAPPGATISGGPEPRARPMDAARPLSVVVVDDDPDVLTPLCSYLERSGFEVRGAASALDALSQVATAAPDCLISDIAMPGMDGLELCRKLKSQHPPYPSC